MSQSVLTSIKKMVGIAEADESFDIDIIIAINSAFVSVAQVGAGKEGVPLIIEDKSKNWLDFFNTEELAAMVKTYVYLSVKLIFDPPQTSFAIASNEKLQAEQLWRIQADADDWSTDGGEDDG